MYTIDLPEDFNNTLNCKYFAVLRPADTWRPGDQVEVFLKKESMGVFTISDMFAREPLDQIAPHLCPLAYGVDKQTLVKRIKDWFIKSNQNINNIKFQWLILTTEAG
mgnify:CR=1 FL=1